MTIGEAAKASGVNAKLIRHYESLGIIPKASRTHAGYRVYSAADVNILSFVRRARGLGFSMKEIKKLISLWRNTSRTSRDVKQLALSHIAAMEDKIAELESMVKTLRHLARTCHGDNRPDCPILEGLAEKTGLLKCGSDAGFCLVGSFWGLVPRLFRQATSFEL